MPRPLAADEEVLSSHQRVFYFLVRSDRQGAAGMKWYAAILACMFPLPLGGQEGGVAVMVIITSSMSQLWSLPRYIPVRLGIFTDSLTVWSFIHAGAGADFHGYK